MILKLVVFDMAGTTVFDGDAVCNCLRESLRQVAGCEVSRQAVNQVMGIPKPLAISQLLAPGDRTDQAGPHVVSAVFRDFQARMLRHYNDGPDVREIDGAADVFRRLKKAGLAVALDTGFNRTIADAVMRRLGWNASGLIDAVATSDDVAAGRPAPDMIYCLMKRTGVENAAEVAKVGDTPADLLEGTNAGCGLVVGVTSGSHTAPELEKFPHTHLIESIRELPDLIVKSERAATPLSGG